MVLHKIKYYTALLILLALSIISKNAIGAQPDYTLEDVFKSYKFSQEGIEDIKFSNDGKHYFKIKADEKYRDIVKYDIARGKQRAIIFKGKDFIVDANTLRFKRYYFSADEQSLLLETDYEKLYRRSSKANFYIYNTKSKNVTPLSVNGKQRLATFSPDATKIGFVRENNLYVKDLSNNKEFTITDDGVINKIINGATDWVYEEEFGFSKAFFWSPDGSKIAYYKFDEERVKEFSMPIYKNNLYPELYTFKYPKAGEENSIVSIWIYDFENKANTKVDIGVYDDQYIPRIQWSNNSSQLTVQRMNREQNKLELLLVDASTGKTNIILREETETYIDVHNNLTFINNSDQFIWTSDKSGYNHIYLYDLAGKELKQLTKGDWEVTQVYGVDQLNQKVYYQSAENSPLERAIYSIDMKGENKKAIFDQKGVNSARFNNAFTYAIHSFSNTETPTVTNLTESSGNIVRALENNHRLEEEIEKVNIGKKEFFSFETVDGSMLNGYMIKPNSFDPSQKYPVMMYVYGGPGSQTVKNQWSSGGRDMWLRSLTNKGYIIVSVDNRGTGARGSTFQKATYKNLGQLETIDQIEAAKYLSSLDYIDKGRIGIFGWSYGGYMSSLCILKGADVFKLAIAVAPVTHWKFYDSIYTERYMNLPKNNQEGYDSNAPLDHVDKLRGKYLLIHGTADDNVHFQNTAVMIERLVQANKQFDLFTYPDKAHGISGGNTSLHIYTKMNDFVLNNL